jgi:hypothetical protein
MELQCEGEVITHLEKVTSVRVLGEKHDIWDVHTDVNRWWVITAPTNLYRQSDFRGMDMALTFHVGLTARMMDRQRSEGSDEEHDRLASTFRRWEQAAEALDKADEAEEFQAVGMRCRECLLSLVREASSADMVPPGEEAPKQGDFVRWSELMAETVAPGPSSERIRAYLKAVANRAWDLVNWLTHATNATRADGQFVLDASMHVVMSFAGALVRMERGEPERCPRCNSYRLTSDFRPELTREPPYVTLCEACGWEDEGAESADGN